MSQGWRTSGPSSAPHGLQHRPAHITRHMSCMLTRAAETPPTTIHCVDDSTYTVLSSSSSQWYTVSFGADIPPDMPSCDCYVWQRSHLPCKHMCAVLIQFELTWDRFPTAYRDHPVLSVDSFCLGVDTIKQDDTTVSSIIDDMHAPDTLCEALGPARPSAPSSSAVDERALLKCASGLRDVLSKLNNVSYIVQSSDVLMQATRDAEAIHRTLLAACPTTDGLLLENASADSKQRNRKPVIVASQRKKNKKPVQCLATAELSQQRVRNRSLTNITVEPKKPPRKLAKDRAGDRLTQEVKKGDTKAATNTTALASVADRTICTGTSFQFSACDKWHCISRSLFSVHLTSLFIILCLRVQ